MKSQKFAQWALPCQKNRSRPFSLSKGQSLYVFNELEIVQIIVGDGRFFAFQNFLVSQQSFFPGNLFKCRSWFLWQDEHFLFARLADAFGTILQLGVIFLKPKVSFFIEAFCFLFLCFNDPFSVDS